MGKIKTKLVKRAAKTLAKDYPDRFSEQFSQNKEGVRALGLSKRLRNQVAGYIAAVKRTARESLTRRETEPVMEENEEEN